jgi:hypothetical protein
MEAGVQREIALLAGWFNHINPVADVLEVGR